MRGAGFLRVRFFWLVVARCVGLREDYPPLIRVEILLHILSSTLAVVRVSVP